MQKSWTMPVAQALQRHTGSWKAPLAKSVDPDLPQVVDSAGLAPELTEPRAQDLAHLRDTVE